MPQDTSLISVRIADWRLDRDALQKIRRTVFIEELSIPAELEWDGRDSSAVHLLAETHDNQAIATVRLLPEGHIGRMAVLQTWRNRGAGTLLMEALLELAHKQQLDALSLNAQSAATGFYLKQGFEAEGSLFEEAGIPHLKMSRTIDRNSSPEILHLGLEDEQPDQNLERITAGKLAETSEPVQLESKSHFRHACTALVHQAKQKIAIFTHDLDGEVYDNMTLLEDLKRLATVSPDVAVSVLLQNNTRVQRERHRLLDLANRLPSKIKIYRPVTKDYLEHAENFMLVDNTGFVFRKLYTRFEGRLEFNNRLRARELSSFFQDAWNESEEDIALRRLGI